MADHITGRPDAAPPGSAEYGFGVWEPFVTQPIPGEYDRTTIPDEPETPDAPKPVDGSDANRSKAAPP